jgi:adenylate kinase family enzyme
MIPLSDFGQRICVFGRSNAGKSSLAAAIGAKTGYPVTHLDLLYHLPNTDWEPRPAGEFELLHGAAIAEDEWVIEGSYSSVLAQRLERATGLIVLNTAALPNLMRYIRRTLFERLGPGRMEQGQDSLKWIMIHHIAFLNPQSARRYDRNIEGFDGPSLHLRSMAEINVLYKAWGLERSVPDRAAF